MAAAPEITSLGREQCLALLSTVPVGRVALCVGALPAIRTVRFALSAGHVVFRASPESALSRHAAGVVAFQADHYEPGGDNGWSVEVLGHSEAVIRPDLMGELARLPLPAWAPDGGEDCFFRVTLEKVSGQAVSWPSGRPRRS